MIKHVMGQPEPQLPIMQSHQDDMPFATGDVA
jgi:hypothetical protein